MIDYNLVIFLYKSGKNQSVIANTIGCSRQRVHQIVSDYRLINAKEKQEIQMKLSGECFNCGLPRENIHHIDKNSRNNNIKNLMSLCKRCHIQIHKGTKRKRHKPIYKRRPILYCEYSLCKKPFFPVEGRETLQKFCKISHRINEFKRKKRLVGVGKSIAF